MDTFYAPPGKASDEDLKTEIRIIAESPVLTGLLQTTSGLLAIVDEHRQIISLNDRFLQLLGIDDPHEALGLRLGEVLDCIHAEDEPAGCGTTQFCSTCGAAVAIVTSLAEGLPAERMCALAAQRCGKDVDLAFRVRSNPVEINGHRFVLVFIQDVTVEQQRAALERTFFHDVNNMVAGIIQASELLMEKHPSQITEIVASTATRLHREIAIQRSLLKADAESYQPTWKTMKIHRILADLRSFFESHPAAHSKRVEVPEALDGEILTDVSALCRVLCNMVINALEATDTGGIVKVWARKERGAVRFFVWNHGAIPGDVSKRVFQRNFSTKAEEGRGIGTFSMKLFGEKILGGRVSFKTSEDEGTTFWLEHPSEAA